MVSPLSVDNGSPWAGHVHVHVPLTSPPPPRQTLVHGDSESDVYYQGNEALVDLGLKTEAEHCVGDNDEALLGATDGWQLTSRLAVQQLTDRLRRRLEFV